MPSQLDMPLIVIDEDIVLIARNKPERLFHRILPYLPRL